MDMKQKIILCCMLFFSGVAFSQEMPPKHKTEHRSTSIRVCSITGQHLTVVAKGRKGLSDKGLVRIMRKGQRSMTTGLVIVNSTPKIKSSKGISYVLARQDDHECSTHCFKNGDEYVPYYIKE
jgi:hypothetical protein